MKRAEHFKTNLKALAEIVSRRKKSWKLIKSDFMVDRSNFKGRRN